MIASPRAHRLASATAPVVPAALLRRLPRAAATAACAAAAAGLPRRAGAYLLLLRLDAPAEHGIARLAPAPLAPGWYAYAGSARGPGGIAARLGRHLAGPARAHWHIDRLTVRAAARLGLAYPDAGECALVAGLLAGGAFAPALPGFGASDCRTCASHLLRWVRRPQ